MLNEAAVLAQHLNAMSADIQTLRSEAEIAIGGAVSRVNEILQQHRGYFEPHHQCAISQAPETAGLHDTRDTLIAELSNA